MNYKKREDAPKEYTWDLSTRYKNNDNWLKDYNIALKQIDKISLFKNKVLESPRSLFDTLELKFNLTIQIEKLYLYARCKLDENIENNEYSLMLNKALSLYNNFLLKEAFIKPEIIKASKEKLNKYLNDPLLLKYNFYLNNLIREQEHYLNESEEQIVSKLTSISDSYENMSNMLTNSIIDYGNIIIDSKEVKLLNSNYRDIITNKDRNVRKEAFYKLTDNLKKYENLYGTNLISNMKLTKNLADIYKFSSVLELDLFNENISKEVYDNLYSVVESNLEVFQKFFNMKKEYLNLDTFEYYDKDALIVDSNKNFTIKETKDILIKSLSILGDDYINIIKKAFDDRWIDFPTYKGKTSSIYSTCNYGDNPLVLTSYQGKFNDVSTLAHELGHAAHFYLSMENNPYHDFNMSLLTAEVASLTNEILLSNYIINNNYDKELKQAAIYNTINIIQNNLFDACLEGKLEKEVYDILELGEEINTEFLNILIYDIKKLYYKDSVNLNDNVRIMWSRRMHYFTPYYLYKYATGVSCAVYISKKIINNEDNMKEKYLNFLKKGGSNYPTELLKTVGIDLTKKEVINETINYMNDLIDEFKKVSEE